MSEVLLSRWQAYDAVREYLAAYVRRASNGQVRFVLGGISTVIWADGEPGDPAVPGDWAQAAALAASRPGTGAEREPRIAATSWFPAVEPFLLVFWEANENLLAADLLKWLAEPEAPPPGLRETPWQIWLQATRKLI